jgi:hypothetical protein
MASSRLAIALYSPFASRDGHDLSRLIDEAVPSAAEVVDDLVEGF